MSGNHSNSAGRAEEVDGGQAQDFGRVFGFGILGVLILALFMAFSAGTVDAATSQTWYLDSDEHPASGTNYYMWKGSTTNCNDDLIVRESSPFYVWLADEAAICDVVFPSGTWNVHIKGFSEGGEVKHEVGYYNTEFHSYGSATRSLSYAPQDYEVDIIAGFTVPEGSYLAFKTSWVSGGGDALDVYTGAGGYYSQISSPPTDPDYPLPVRLSSFTATAGDGQVILRWITESEVDNLGFHVYRALEAAGEYERLTAEMIAGAGTSTSRREYAFADVRLANGVTYWYKLQDVAFDGTTTMHGPVSVTPQAEEAVEVQALPTEFGLSQNVPNPFNPTTEIRYQVPEASHVELAIYDALGQKIQVLVDGFVNAGYRSVVWEAEDVASGIYFVRLEAGDFVEVRKMVLIR